MYSRKTPCENFVEGRRVSDDGIVCQICSWEEGLHDTSMYGNIEEDHLNEEGKNDKKRR